MGTLPVGEEMVGDKLWDYEFTVNANQVSHSFDFGIGEPTNVTGFPDQFQFDHQSQTSFSFTSLLQDFETDNAFAEYHENLINQQSNPMNQQSDMVQNHVVSCGDGYVMVHDHGLSSEEEAILEFTPTPELEMMMEELAPYSSMVPGHGFTSDESMLDFISTSIVVRDHVISSTEGNTMMVEGALPPFAFHSHAVSHEREITNNSRPNLTYGNGSKPRLRWTQGLHAWFVSAVKHLGGCETATPKRILSLMDVPGLTRYHIKSHLQKYRNGGCWLVDGMDRTERAARRASISRLRQFSSNPSSSISPVPQGPSDSPRSSRITQNGCSNARNRKTKGKGKGSGSGKGKGKGKAKKDK